MEGEVRVSCGSMCRLMVEESYLLLLNRNRRRKGIYELSPVGGAIQVQNVQALAPFEARLENPDTRDLRFSMRSEHLDVFGVWFRKRKERELDPFREILEELVDESGVLAALRPEDLRMDFVKIVQDSKQTMRQGKTGIFTHYFFEIFEVRPRSTDVLLRLKNPPLNSGVVLLDEATARKAEPLKLRFDGEERTVGLNTSYLFL
ncbi:MAG: hypothetical protein DPW16_11430 [Chloroflexi bacterium]|nr:hypothetical protein [Chloroflexota bacterium]